VERPALEVADIFRDFGPAWRDANRGRVSHAQLKVMSAIEACRTAALGGYAARCQNAECGHTVIAYCSCRNRRPRCKRNLTFPRMVGCGHVFGLLLQPLWPLAMM